MQNVRCNEEEVCGVFFILKYNQVKIVSTYIGNIHNSDSRRQTLMIIMFQIKMIYTMVVAQMCVGRVHLVFICHQYLIFCLQIACAFLNSSLHRKADSVCVLYHIRVRRFTIP